MLDHGWFGESLSWFCQSCKLLEDGASISRLTFVQTVTAYNLAFLSWDRFREAIKRPYTEYQKDYEKALPALGLVELEAMIPLEQVDQAFMAIHLQKLRLLSYKLCRFCVDFILLSIAILWALARVLALLFLIAGMVILYAPQNYRYDWCLLLPWLFYPLSYCCIWVMRGLIWLAKWIAGAPKFDSGQEEAGLDAGVAQAVKEAQPAAVNSVTADQALPAVLPASEMLSSKATHLNGFKVKSKKQRRET